MAIGPEWAHGRAMRVLTRSALLFENGLPDLPALLVEAHRNPGGIWRIKFSYETSEPLSMSAEQATTMAAALHEIGETELADEIAVRRKRAGHLLSKGRYLGAQILAMLDGDLWLDNARAANAVAQTLARAAPSRLVYPVEANEIFLKMSAEEAASLRSQGFDFYDWAPGEIRLVTSWDQQGDAVDRLAAAIAAL